MRNNLYRKKADRKKKIAVIIGTRPEVIKVFPIIKLIEAEYSNSFEYKLIVTGQHKTMLKQALNFFKLQPDYNLNIMREDQKLSALTASCLISISKILKQEQPEFVLVQGDTTSTFTGALSAFYHKISIGHIEAGLRTYDKYQPFPEEINRHLVDVMADFCFAPTENNKENLIREGISPDKIFVTGNTGIDTLFLIKESHKDKLEKQLLKLGFSNNEKIILVTAHRRENFGEGIKNICKALIKVSQEFPEYKVIYPIHKNPNIKNVVTSLLSGVENIVLLPTLNYIEFISLVAKSYLILTDSGGIQEEAPVFEKPVLVMREKTERMEGVNSGVSKLVGTQPERIFSNVEELIRNKKAYDKMANAINPYGDGKASQRILELLQKNKMSVH
ncbi:MAG: UDP-N-acetylglucosamine 2-epimerase (non-hydrolyzing) [Candidatus Cloacimonadota bacterium]|nr:UDP-N-acetylglucosamine 2-epimerase (non-hydrolyzing) [Candidatus Cloacimonadota bacterium]